MNIGRQLLTPTPIQYLGRGPKGQKLYIKRDDLLGFSFGGNKCRIGAALLEDMEKKGADFLISYGSRKSNLNRVLAAMCKSRKIPCLVICSEEEGAGKEDTFNAEIIRRMGIQSVPCGKTRVAETVERVLEQVRDNGFVPYYIYGNQYGKGNEAAVRQAYRRAYQEIAGWQEEQNIYFNQIFLASGTGMTQGGLLAGQREYLERLGTAGRPVQKIIGISVARDEKTGKEAVGRYAGLNAETGSGIETDSSAAADERIYFLDEYRCGGYGCYDSYIEDVIQNMMEEHGIPLDPTYTGKAYAGMLKLLESSGTDRDCVLFLHTGGLPLYFDYLRQK